VVTQLKNKGRVSRGWIGAQIQPVTADIAGSLDMRYSVGALVAEPQADSPAANAGVLSGDVITALNGHQVKDARDLIKQSGAMAPGTPAKLTLWRQWLHLSADGSARRGGGFWRYAFVPEQRQEIYGITFPI
jgi:serine protease Do